ncbi:hypothetical protein J4457_05920 [Candidatus Woesearchaeota archaeon]|nr:hypothetical protein [Candidatus Woesearchaeota archaeon]
MKRIVFFMIMIMLMLPLVDAKVFHQGRGNGRDDLRVSHILINDQVFPTIRRGSSLSARIFLENTFDENIDNLKVKMIIHDLGIYASNGPDDFDGSRTQVHLSTEIPSWVAPGMYYITFYFGNQRQRTDDPLVRKTVTRPLLIR